MFIKGKFIILNVWYVDGVDSNSVLLIVCVLELCFEYLIVKVFSDGVVLSEIFVFSGSVDVIDNMVYKVINFIVMLGGGISGEINDMLFFMGFVVFSVYELQLKFIEVFFLVNVFFMVKGCIMVVYEVKDLLREDM